VRGVFAIYTAQDLHDLVEPARATSRLRDYHATALYPLAREKVPRSRFRNGAPVRHSIRQGAADLAGQPSAIEGGLTHYWGGVGLQWTLRWRKADSNPRSLVSTIYAKTGIAADREHRGRLIPDS
jgi:hypothetical protein